MDKTAANPDNATATVLIVDDYLTLTEVIDRRLRIAGMRTRTCAGGADAIKVLREEHVDLVILDIMMPDVDGYEVMRFIRDQQRTRDLPVIMLTACSTEEHVAKATQLGADWFITKPFNGEDLVRQVQRLLVQHRARVREVAPAPSSV